MKGLFAPVLKIGLSLGGAIILPFGLKSFTDGIAEDTPSQSLLVSLENASSVNRKNKRIVLINF